MDLGIFKNVIIQPLKKMFKRDLRSAWESPLYKLSRCRVSAGKIRHIVFVCKGNICRSAFAENYLASILPLDTLVIESCGLEVDQAVLSPPEAVNAAGKLGINLSSHLSRGFENCDLQNADLIVPMEYTHMNQLINAHPEYKIKLKLLRDFAPFPSNLSCNIYDPFGQGPNEYDRCFKLMRKALNGLAYSIQRVVRE